MITTLGRALRIPVLAVVASFGCATAYTPRPSHRISFTEAGGGLRLTHDSQSFGIWDADRAVVGNPRAEAEARTYVHRTMAGLIFDFAGLGLLVGGEILGHPPTSEARRDGAAGMAVGGALSIATALVLLVTGAPHLYDAINIYNDGVPPDPAP